MMTETLGGVPETDFEFDSIEEMRDFDRSVEVIDNPYIIGIGSENINKNPHQVEQNRANERG